MTRERVDLLTSGTKQFICGADQRRRRDEVGNGSRPGRETAEVIPPAERCPDWHSLLTERQTPYAMSRTQNGRLGDFQGPAVTASGTSGGGPCPVEMTGEDALLWGGGLLGYA